MFKTTRQLKNFITWCKENGVSEATVGDISFKVQPDVKEIPLSEIFKPEYSADSTEPADALQTNLVNPLMGNRNAEDEEELLFWSSGK